MIKIESNFIELCLILPALKYNKISNTYNTHGATMTQYTNTISTFELLEAGVSS
jgi:hypothetical protein